MEHVKHLIYPCPQPNFAGLGTHVCLLPTFDTLAYRTTVDDESERRYPM